MMDLTEFRRALDDYEAEVEAATIRLEDRLRSLIPARGPVGLERTPGMPAPAADDDDDYGVDKQRQAAGRASAAKSKAAGPYPCPSCDRVFATPQGRGSHVKTMHPGVDLKRLLALGGWPKRPPEADGPAQESKPMRPTWVPKAEAKPNSVVHAGKERFLCGRCEAFFPTAESRDRHESNHAPVPPGRPVGRQTVGARA